MGHSQSANEMDNSSIKQLFPSISEFKSINNSSINNNQKCTGILYSNIRTGQTATIKSFQVANNKKLAIEMYYSARTQMCKNPHIYDIIDAKILTSKSNKSSRDNSLDVSSTMCTIRTIKSNQNQYLQNYNLWIFVQTSNFCLEDQILNRVNKKSFEEIQIWSVLSSCVLGTINLLQNGFKQPVLSPKGIGLSKDGIVKVGQWELISQLNQHCTFQQGEVIFSNFGQKSHEFQKNSLNQLLLNYYWPPQGLRAMQSLIALGQKNSQITSLQTQRKYTLNQTSLKFQIFSLGMSLISMCLRSCFYRIDTFSEKYLQKLIHQATQIRKVQGKQLSQELKFIISSMIKWDPQQRISYTQLRDLILQFFNDHPQQIKNSSVSIKTFQFISQSDQASAKAKKRNQSLSSHSSMNLTEQQSFVDSYSFALAQAGIKFKNNLQKIGKFKNKQSHHVSSTSSAFDRYEGSGMIEQGTGDDDSHLQQQIIQQNDQNVSITQRSDKSLKPMLNKSHKKSNPPTSKRSQKEYVCPNPTPQLSSTPVANRNPYLYQYSNSVQKMQKQQRSPLKINHFKTNSIYLQSQAKQEPYNHKNAKHKQQQQIIHDYKLNQDYLLQSNNSMLNVQNRGSYRSSQKQPPKLCWAKPVQNQTKYSIIDNLKYQQKQLLDSTYPQICYSSSLNKQNYHHENLLSKSIKQSKHEIIIQYVNGYPNFLKQSQLDEQDQINDDFPYNNFSTVFQQKLQSENNNINMDEQIQNPDIFEQNQQIFTQPTFTSKNSAILEQFQEEHKQSSRSFMKPQPIYQNSCNQQILNVDKTKQIVQEYDKYEQEAKREKQALYDTQFMTFNQILIPLQNNQKQMNTANLNLLPSSKWRSPQKPTNLQYLSNNSQQSSLFTDPKLLQFIRSPFKNQYNNQVQNTSRFNPSQFIKTTKSIDSCTNIYEQPKSSLNSFRGKENEVNNSWMANNQVNNKNRVYEKAQKIDNSYRLYQQKDTNQQMNRYYLPQSYCSSNMSKIVKQQVSKGFYEGEKKNGMRCGYGVFYYNEGGKYKGNWLNNKMHGKGTLEYADGRVAYQGDWSCDELHGKGVLYNQSPNFITENLNYYDLDQLDECWIYYEGSFEHDDKSGQGLLLLSNHQQFVGEFKNDMADGQGQYLRADGTVVKGIWAKNKLIRILDQ